MDLLKFCHSSTLYNIDKPFSRGEWTYATDGRIMIRVPRVDGYDEDKGPKDVADMFQQAVSREDFPVWQPLPDFKLVHKHCPACNGYGWQVYCPEVGNPYCYGFGEDDKCRGYDDECLRPCNPGTDKAKPCEICNGTGSMPVNQGPVVDGTVSKVRINAIYLDKIKGLPGVQIAPYDSNSVIQIKFAGGEGLLMPMRL